MTRNLMITTAIAALLAFSPAAWAQDAGRVSRILKAGYGTPPAKSRIQVYRNHQVVMRETLETVSRGAMEIRLKDGSVFTLGPKAEVLIDEFVFNPDTFAGTKTVSLIRGALRYVSGDMYREGVILRTRTATIGIRGTILLLNVSADGSETISVVAGAVTITLANGDQIDLAAEQSYLIDRLGIGIGVVNDIVPTPSTAVNSGMDAVDNSGDDDPDGAGGSSGGGEGGGGGN